MKAVVALRKSHDAQACDGGFQKAMARIPLGPLEDHPSGAGKELARKANCHNSFLLSFRAAILLCSRAVANGRIASYRTNRSPRTRHTSHTCISVRRCSCQAKTMLPPALRPVLSQSHICKVSSCPLHMWTNDVVPYIDGRPPQGAMLLRQLCASSDHRY